jgi:hypothetical protein
MTRTRAVLTGFAAVLLTGAAYVVALFVTGFLACGLSGCSGGGFGPSFSPGQAQVGLLVTGACLAPVAVLGLGGRGLGRRVAVGAAATLAGSVLAMAVLDLGPHGCPLGQSRATADAEAFDPGAATCSADRHALP